MTKHIDCPLVAGNSHDTRWYLATDSGPKMKSPGHNGRTHIQDILASFVDGEEVDDFLHFIYANSPNMRFWINAKNVFSACFFIFNISGLYSQIFQSN